MRLAVYAMCVGLLLISPDVRGETPHSQNAPITIKIATLVPEGSLSMDIAHEYEAYVKKETAGGVKFIWYTSGVMGDEPEVVRKIMSGQLDAGLLSGVGLGWIVPEVRVLELPLLFNNYDEVDHVLAKLDNTFRKLFEDKGIVLLGWGEQGFIYLFTNTPLRTAADLKEITLWVWQGDSFAETIFESIGLFITNPIPVTKVLSSLQSGVIDAFYNTPIGAVALQWYPYVKYIMTRTMNYGTGALIMRKKSFIGYPAKVREALIGGEKKILSKFLPLVRRDNAVVLASFPKKGIKFVTPDPTLEKIVREKVEIAEIALSKKFYPDWLLRGVKQTLENYRRK